MTAAVSDFMRPVQLAKISCMPDERVSCGTSLLQFHSARRNACMKFSASAWY